MHVVYAACGLDAAASVLLFFLAGVHHELAYLRAETSGAWNGYLVDVLAVNVARAAITALLFRAMGLLAHRDRRGFGWHCRCTNC